jgi:thiol-disulfide isomerase/thioredoxin
MLGRELPTFRRRTVAGAAIDTATWRGQVVVVEFFAAYCQPCQRALPALEKWHARHRDVVVLGVSVDEDLQDALDQVTRYRLTFPVIHDAGNVLGGRFRVSSIPITFVSSATGRIVWVGGPEQSEDAFGRAAANTE